ncbi:glycine betaine ABC transporter substrate-binding protein, partial [Rhizobium ruizarguesonis]
KDIDVANGAATDWQIGSKNLVPLADYKGLFPPYYVAPVVRQDVLKSNPKVAELLEAVGTLRIGKLLELLELGAVDTLQA